MPGALLFGCALALAYQRLAERNARDRRQMQEALASAQLDALRLQLHPHFLFNTLNSIAELIHSSPERAERMVTQLSELLRLTLHGGAEPTTSLERELECLFRYVEIQRVRFGDRLRVRLDLEPGIRDAEVPFLILQPLVENAVRHGVAPLKRGGCITISAGGVGSRLHVRVEDNGRGPGAPGSLREGVGLRNTRARLATLYGADGRFELHPAPDGGTVASLDVPLRRHGGGALPERQGVGGRNAA